MRPCRLALGLSLLAAPALAVAVGDFYGKWSRGDCAEEWVMFSDGKVTQFSTRFQAVETAESPSAARRPAPAPQAAKPPEPPKPPAPAAAPAAAPAKAADPANPDQPRNPATARKLVDPQQPRNPATARKVAEEPKTAAAPAPVPPAPASKQPPKSKEMVLPATFRLDGDRLAVETQEHGRKPRREIYAMVDKDTLVLQDTFVDGRRIPPITRDQVTYRRCK